MVRRPPPLLPPLIALVACLALAACGTTPPNAAGESGFYRPSPEDFYPATGGAALGPHPPPPEAPECLRTAEPPGFASERAFADCRRDLEVYGLALALWSRRAADRAADESRRRSEGALAAFTCKLTGVGGPSCAPVDHAVAAPAGQPRPPACVGDALPLVLDDGGGPGLDNCRYGVARYRDNLTEWARRVAHEVRTEARARFDAAVDRFNCRLLAEPYSGVPCRPPDPLTDRLVADCPQPFC